MATFNFDAFIEYDYFLDAGPNPNNKGTANLGDGSGDVGALAVTGNDDTQFDLNEDGTGNGNVYMGSITVNGVQLPIFSASVGGNPDYSNVFVGLHGGIDRHDLPNSFNTQDTSAANFFYTDTSFFYCFAEGTLIQTARGEVPVEEITRDDLVVTTGGDAVPVLWLGVQTIRPTFVPARNLGLVTISAGALGDGLPHSDLTVTGDHGMVVDGLVVNAAALVNGTSIREVPRSEMAPELRVYHIETPNHEAILANGAPAESFIDVAGRRAFDNYDDYLSLYGAERVIPAIALPRVSSSRLLPKSLRARLGLGASEPALARRA